MNLLQATDCLFSLQEAAGEEVVEKEASEPFRTEEAIEPEGGQAVSDEVTEVVEEPSTPETRPTNGGGGEESPTRLILQPAPLEDIAEEEEEVDRETIIQEIKVHHLPFSFKRGYCHVACVCTGAAC